MADGFSIKKNKKQIVLFLLFVLTSLPFFLNIPSTNEIHSSYHELYDPKLHSIRSVNDLVRYNDSLVALGSSTNDTVEFVESLSTLTKRRFRHGLANYSITDNWITNLSGKVFWSHFLSIVDADDILKHNEGLCSQQSIVFLQALKGKGIPARSVGLGKKGDPGHFLTEVKYANDWHVYDVSSEPDWSHLVEPHRSMAYYEQHKDTLYKAYEHQMSREFFDTVTSKVNYGNVGEFPAKKMRFFHQFTYVMTVVFPFLFLLLLINSIYRTRLKSKEK
jgi:hypothetical protein